MSNLISGKEALVALANGKDVLYINQECIALNIGEWADAKELTVFQILSGFWALRLKPQTVTLNGIEVPAPDYIVNTPHNYSGTWEINIGEDYYLYKFESDYKQVVEALRKAFKPQ